MELDGVNFNTTDLQEATAAADELTTGFAVHSTAEVGPDSTTGVGLNVAFSFTQPVEQQWHTAFAESAMGKLGATLGSDLSTHIDGYTATLPTASV